MNFSKMRNEKKPVPEQDDNLLIAELTAQVQSLSVRNHILESEKQSLEQKMLMLTAKIERLSESDRELKQSEKLKQESEKLKSQAEAENEKAKSRLRDSERNLMALASKNDALDKREANLDAEAERKAENLSEAKIEGIKKAYKTKTGAFFALCFGSLLYGVLITILTALRSEAFKSDFIEFFVTAGKCIAFLWEKLLWLSDSAGNLCKAIPNDTAAMIIGIIVTLLVFLLILGVVGGGILYGTFLLIRWYSVHLADYISVAFFLIPFALLTFFADEVRAFTGINTLVLILVIHVLYGVIRMVSGGSKKNLKDDKE